MFPSFTTSFILALYGFLLRGVVTGAFPVPANLENKTKLLLGLGGCGGIEKAAWWPVVICYHILSLLIFSYSTFLCFFGVITAYLWSSDGWILSLITVFFSRSENQFSASLASLLSWFSLFQLLETLMIIRIRKKLTGRHLVERVGLVLVNEVFYAYPGPYLFLPSFLGCLINFLIHLCLLVESGGCGAWVRVDRKKLVLKYKSVFFLCYSCVSLLLVGPVWLLSLLYYFFLTYSQQKRQTWILMGDEGEEDFEEHLELGGLGGQKEVVTV